MKTNKEYIYVFEEHLRKSCYLSLMNFIASNAFSTFIIGKIGPKISFCITGSSGLTFIRIVGSMNKSSGSVFPPIAISAPLSNAVKRLNNRKQKLIINIQKVDQTFNYLKFGKFIIRQRSGLCCLSSP